MQVLLTNDDGVDAEGIQTLRTELMQYFDSVVTLAPQGNCSGFARSCTFSRPISVRRRQGGSHPVYSCDGTPTDCVRAGLLGGLAPDAKLVVSGINHGANLADDVTTSGTVGAGLEAAILGVSSLCISQQTPTGSLAVNYQEDLALVRYDFELSAKAGAAVAASLARLQVQSAAVLSMNFPSTLTDDVVRITRPGMREYPRNSARSWTEDEIERQLFLYGETDEIIPERRSSEDTDIMAIREGHISLTPLSLGLGFGEDSGPREFRPQLVQLVSDALPRFRILSA